MATPLPARPELRLTDIAVLPDARGQGLGSALVAAVLGLAQQDGATVSLTVYQDNRALNLYRRLGFQPVGSENGRVLLRWHPAPEELALRVGL